MPQKLEWVVVHTYVLSKSHIVPIFTPIFGAFFIPKNVHWMATLGTARSISAGNRYPASSWILQTPRPLRLLNHCNIILMKQEPTYLVGTYRYVHVMDINNTYIIIIRYYVIHLLCNKSRKMILLRICFAYKKHTKTPSPPRLFVSPPPDAHMLQGLGEGISNE